MPVTITNTGGEFQLSGAVNLGHCLIEIPAGGADIRFTSDNRLSEIDFWIESWNSGLRPAYGLSPTVDASPATTTIFMYYCNSGAQGASDGF